LAKSNNAASVRKAETLRVLTPTNSNSCQLFGTAATGTFLAFGFFIPGAAALAAVLGMSATASAFLVRVLLFVAHIHVSFLKNIVSEPQSPASGENRGTGRPVQAEHMVQMAATINRWMGQSRCGLTPVI
jgi:hypothetical protein